MDVIRNPPAACNRPISGMIKKGMKYRNRDLNGRNGETYRRREKTECRKRKERRRRQRRSDGKE